MKTLPTRPTGIQLPTGLLYFQDLSPNSKFLLSFWVHCLIFVENFYFNIKCMYLVPIILDSQ